MKLQIRAEFYNLFNHPNLYVIGGTNNVNVSSFNRSDGKTVAGVTAFFKDSRQVVVALKLLFQIASLDRLFVNRSCILAWSDQF